MKSCNLVWVSNVQRLGHSAADFSRKQFGGARLERTCCPTRHPLVRLRGHEDPPASALRQASKRAPIPRQRRDILDKVPGIRLSVVRNAPPLFESLSALWLQ